MSFTALTTSNSGVQAASAFIDVVGNNVANQSTTGYKTSQVTFRDLLYLGLAPGASSNGETPPGGIQVGTGTSVDGVTGLFTQGPLNRTGRALDVAIDGPGFFQVTLPDGTTAYTRDGNLHVDSNGQLATADGFLVSPAVTLTGVTGPVSIGPDGTVTAETDAGTQSFGQITLTRFTNPGGLLRVGDNQYLATASAGTATTAAPGAEGLGTLAPQTLEGSNVDISTELVNLIVAQRAFQVNAQAIIVENAVLSATTALISD